MTQPSIRPSSTEEYISRINRVLAYVERHLADDLSLAVLARESCFSPFHFHRIFQAIVGETPVDFVKRVRLERAALMLIHNPRRTITEIAIECGFSSSATFSRAFSEAFETSPSSWRQKSKNGKLGSRKRKASALSIEYPGSTRKRAARNNQSEMPMNVTIKEMPAKHIAYVANLEGYIQEKIDQAWSRLCGWAGPLGLLESAEIIGMSFDNPDITPKSKCRYYACMTVPDNTSTPKDIGLMDIPAGRYAVLPFDGTTDDISDAYRAFYAKWLPQSGFEPDDRPCYEVYHSSPNEDPEGHFVMDICMPIRPL